MNEYSRALEALSIGLSTRMTVGGMDRQQAEAAVAVYTRTLRAAVAAEIRLFRDSFEVSNPNRWDNLSPEEILSLAADVADKGGAKS